MRVILNESIDKLGDAGEVVTVRDGFGRNYLLPRKLAVVATEKDVARFEHDKRVIAARTAKMVKELQGQAEKLNQVSVSITAQVGEGDKLYGSVTSRDISEALKAQGVQIDSKKLGLAEPIKTLGMTEVPVKLGSNVTANIKVWVVKKE
ncbi:MAG TPA: 50S ribosomal protein L9 [Polyangia bacterium]